MKRPIDPNKTMTNFKQTRGDVRYRKGEMMNYDPSKYISRHSSNLKNYYNNKQELMQMQSISQESVSEVPVKRQLN